MAVRSVLFVCMGNICRSPAAEGVFRRKVAEAGLADKVHIASAGTIGYHTGDLPDKRMRAAASARGYQLDSRAQQVKPKDLAQYDLVLAMDRDNLFHLHALDADNQFAEKIKLLGEYHPEKPGIEVPDPYYGGAEGFELVLDILEKACDTLVKKLED